MEIKGTYTAMITPFKGGQVDFEGLTKNIHYQLDNGINGLLALGTTAETPTLNEDEKISIINLFVEEAGGKVPVVVGTGSNSTEHTIENTRKAKELGADVVLIVTPYYNKPTQNGIFLHFQAVCDQVDIPIIVYNIQGRTGKNIETSTLKRIAELPNIIGVKEASGSVDQMENVIHQIAMKKENFNVMSGDDGLTVPLLSIGGTGVISVLSNLVPDKVVQMVNAGLKGDFETAREIHYRLLPLVRAAFIESNPIPIKAAMEMCDMPAGGVRLPLCVIQPKHKELVKEVLAGMNLIK